MIRNAAILCLAVVALVGSVTAAFATAAVRDDALQGYVDPTRDSAVPYYEPRPGVSIDLTQFTTDELDSELSALAMSGVVWIDTPVDWAQIEVEEDRYDWADWDRVTGAILAYPSLRLIARIANPPVWAALAEDEYASLAIFAQTFAQRYGQQVDTYVVGGNLGIDCGQSGTAQVSSDLAAAIDSVYNPVHRADSTAHVIAAICAPVEAAPNELESLYVRGFEANTDGIAIDIRTQPDVAQDALVEIRNTMIRHGDARKPLWIIGGDSVQIAPVIDKAGDEWPWIGGIILGSWDADVTPVLAAPNGLHSAQSPFARYTGVWTFGARGADIGWIEDSIVTFTFTGTEVALMVRESDIVAHLYITIDGRPANALPTDPDGNAFLLLTSDRLDTVETLVTVARDLEPGVHVLRANADALDPDDVIGQWSLAGFAVSAGDLRGPYNQQIAIAWLSAAIALLAVVSVVWHVLSVRVSEQTISQHTAPVLSDAPGPLAVILGAAASVLLMLGVFLAWRDDTPAMLRRDSVHILIALATSGLIYLEPGFILTLAAGLILFIVIARRLEVGLMLIVFWAPFFLFPIELYQFAFPIAEIILYVTLAAAIFRGAYTIAQQYISSTDVAIRSHISAIRGNIGLLDWTIMLFVAVGCVSILWADYRDAALTELRTLIIQPALFYGLLRIIARGSHSRQRLALTLIASGSAVAAIGLFDFARGESVITAEEGARRLASVYGSPNNVGLLLGRCIPFALAFALRPSTDLLLLWSIRIGLGLMALAAVLTQSVGALVIGIPAGIVTVIILTYRRRAAVPVALLIVAGIAGIAVATTLPRFERGFDLTEGTNFYRLRVWQSAINIVEDHPVTGLGLDQFLYAFRGRYIMPDAWEEPTLSHPHNVILDFWTRLGLAGVAVFIIMQAVFWRNAVRRYRKDANIPSTRSSTIVIGMIGCMTNLLTHGMVDNSVFVLDLAFIFMLLLAFGAAFQNNSAIDERSETMV
jgi:O-antigen ligase